jgi:hypothetical protein
MVQVIQRWWFVVTRENGTEILLHAVPPLWGKRNLEQMPLLFTCSRRAQTCRRMVQGDDVEREPYEKYQAKLF